jgi:hypothetical protein
MRNFYYACLCLVFPFFSFAGEKEDVEELESLQAVKATPFLLRVGAGTGSVYGGWFGAGMETGFQYFTLIGGAGFIPGYFSWSAGCRIYLLDPSYPLRFSLNATYGPVYVYSVSDGSGEHKGVVNGYSPGIIIVHSLGKKRVVSLSYGISAWIREPIPQSDRRSVESVLGNNSFGIGVCAGVNWNIESMFPRPE